MFYHYWKIQTFSSFSSAFEWTGTGVMCTIEGSPTWANPISPIVDYFHSTITTVQGSHNPQIFPRVEKRLQIVVLPMAWVYSRYGTNNWQFSHMSCERLKVKFLLLMILFSTLFLSVQHLCFSSRWLLFWGVPEWTCLRFFPQQSQSTLRGCDISRFERIFPSDNDHVDGRIPFSASFFVLWKCKPFHYDLYVVNCPLPPKPQLLLPTARSHRHCDCCL